MLRARAPAGQGLGGPCRRRRRRTATGWLLDGHETVPLQAFEHSERRRQQFAALAVVPTPACDRRLDDGDQELGCCPSVTRFHRRAADPGEPVIQKSPEPSAPTRSPTTDSIRAKLIPRDSDDFRRSYSRWLSPAPKSRPLRIQSPLSSSSNTCSSLGASANNFLAQSDKSPSQPKLMARTAGQE